MPQTLKNWRAKRVGAAMTVYGEDATTRAAIKITGVDVIAPGLALLDFHCLAKDRHGVTHKLLVG